MFGVALQELEKLVTVDISQKP